MARPKAPLGQYLEWHGSGIRVTLPIPAALRPLFGGKTRLKRGLDTDSPARAAAIKHGVIQALRDEMEAARRAAGAKRPAASPVVAEALQWRSEREGTGDGAGGGLDAAGFRILLDDRAEELERTAGTEAAHAFHDIATGRATPLTTPMEDYLREARLSERSNGEVRRSVAAFAAWCAEAKVAPTIEAVSRRVAGRFVSEALLPSRERATAAKYVSFLSGYWRWLERRGYVADNPWSNQVGKAKAPPGAAKRPLRDDEAAALLYGRASPRLADAMRIAALSGMRIDEICRLRVGDCVGGWFKVNARRASTGEGKTDAAERRVPVHPDLAEIMKRRSTGRADGAFLIGELPEPPAGQPRSSPLSKEFTRYRRAVGVDERPNGGRQSNVDFHSWRRWFITKARDGGADPWALAEIAGHDKEAMPLGMTMGRYAGPTQDAVLLAVVAAVRLPAWPVPLAQL